MFHTLPDPRGAALSTLREQETSLINRILQHHDNVDAITKNLLTRKDAVALDCLRNSIRHDMAQLREITDEISFRYSITFVTDPC